eukprot:887839_1
MIQLNEQQILPHILWYRNSSVTPTNVSPNHPISTQTSSSAGNGIGNTTDSNTLPTIVIVQFLCIVAILMVCVVVCIVVLMKRNKSAAYDNQMVSEVNEVQQMEPQNVIRSPPVHPVPIVLEICGDDSPYDVDGNGEGNIDGNINQPETIHDGDVYPLSNIALDEFVIVGD